MPENRVNRVPICKSYWPEARGKYVIYSPRALPGGAGLGQRTKGINQHELKAEKLLIFTLAEDSSRDAKIKCRKLKPQLAFQTVDSEVL